MIATLHNNLAWVVVALNLAVGLWGVVLWRLKGGAPRAFWIALGVAWGSIYVQGILGILMFQDRQPSFRHHFYGFLFVIITLITFTMRGEEPSKRLPAFALPTLFIGIVAVRATFASPF